jgi:hypothetical protein
MFKPQIFYLLNTQLLQNSRKFLYIIFSYGYDQLLHGRKLLPEVIGKCIHFANRGCLHYVRINVWKVLTILKTLQYCRNSVLHWNLVSLLLETCSLERTSLVRTYQARNLFFIRLVLVYRYVLNQQLKRHLFSELLIIWLARSWIWLCV